LYPAEIEELVGNVPGIRQGCVVAFGATDTKRATEQLVVVAETKEKNKQKREEIKVNINAVLSSAMEIIPDEIVLVAPRTVPKTSSGKLQRAACKNKYLEGRLQKKQIPAWMQIVRLAARGAFHKVASGLSFIAKLIYTIYAIALLCVTFLPLYVVVRVSPRHFAAKASRVYCRGLLIGIFCPVKITHPEYLASRSPLIYTANHASYMDSVVMMAILPAGTRVVAKRELFTTPLLRTFMRKLGHLGIDRLDLSKGLEDAKQIELNLKQGHSMLIFPEGTFGYASGLRPFRLGAFKVSAETGIPICPIALKGTRAILRGNEKLLKPGRITVTVCEPITPNGKEWQEVTQLRDAVRADIAAYCGEPSLDFIAAQTVAS
jgi:1-acyl-sn-glycerol-3-phosphate acyltransferase